MNIITHTQANSLKLKLVPSEALITGFGGYCARSQGKTNINVEINDLTINSDVEVTDYNLSEVDLMLVAGNL